MLLSQAGESLWGGGFALCACDITKEYNFTETGILNAILDMTFFAFYATSVFPAVLAVLLDHVQHVVY